MKLLTPKQRTLLAQVARRGWTRLNAAGAIDESFDDWRHRQALQACGHTISAAPVDAFDDLFVHFLAEAGQTDEAFRRAMDKRSNAQRNMLRLIRAALAAGGLAEGYAVKIASNKWAEKLQTRIDRLDELPLSVLKTLLFDVRRAVKSRLQTA